MVASFVLIVGVLLVMAIAGVVFTLMGNAAMLGWVLPWAPMLIMIGTALLMLMEIPLFLGSKEDRRSALRDIAYLLPTFLVSAGLWFLAQYYLW